MPDSQRPERLSERDREILRDIIEAHIASGEPVSSRAVAKGSRYQLSAATVRNVMADLEDFGYLVQPHTSAGRVPTPAGYHLFIDSLMPARELPARDRRYIDENFRGAPVETERLTALASHLLSELSDQVGVVLTPAMGETVLRAVDFVPLSGQRALCVVVASGGAVESKVIETPEPLSREEMIRISNYLTENFAGLTLVEVRARLLQRMAEERDQMDRLLSLAISLASQGIGAGPGREVVVDGTSSLLANPELADVGRLRRLLDAFNDKARLVQLLNRCVAGAGMRVFIGEDSDLTSELDLSLVATTYGHGGRASGSLGIVGPPRMAYPRIIPLVHYLGRALSEALAPADRK